MDRKTLLQYCRYYKGGKVSPFEKTDYRFTAWRIEALYVHAMVNDLQIIEDCISDYIIKGMTDFSKTDDVPLSLKAFLMNRYFQYAEREDIDEFKAFYKKAYLNLQ